MPLRARQRDRPAKNGGRQQITEKRCQRETTRAKPAKNEYPFTVSPNNRTPVRQTGPPADPRAEICRIIAERRANGAAKKPQIMVMPGGDRRRVTCHRRVAPESGAKIMPPLQRRRQIAAKTDTPVKPGHRIIRWHLTDKAMCDLKRQRAVTCRQQTGDIRPAGDDDCLGGDLPAITGMKRCPVGVGNNPLDHKIIDRIQIAKQMRQKHVRPDRPCHPIMDGAHFRRAGNVISSGAGGQQIGRPSLRPKNLMPRRHAFRRIERHDPLANNGIRQVRQARRP